jgi:hypothetical protein
MARKLLAGVVLVVALGAVGAAAAGQQPMLRSAKAVHRHVVIKLSVTDVRPVEFTVAKRRAVDANGALLRQNVRLQETIDVSPSVNGVVSWRSPKALRPGTFFVQVKAVETGGTTDCPRFSPGCNIRWSNIRRVVVRHSS